TVAWTARLRLLAIDFSFANKAVRKNKTRLSAGGGGRVRKGCSLAARGGCGTAGGTKARTRDSTPKQYRQKPCLSPARVGRFDETTMGWGRKFRFPGGRAASAGAR